MNTIPSEIRMAGGGDRRAVMCVIRGTDLDGLAFTGDATGRIHVVRPTGKTDVYRPTTDREVDPLTGAILVVYVWECYGPASWVAEAGVGLAGPLALSVLRPTLESVTNRGRR